jgi:hypothetical protein
MRTSSVSLSQADQPTLLLSSLSALLGPLRRKLILPLERPLASVRPIAKLPKVPTGLGLENALKGIFEWFSSMFCLSPGLTCENFDGHVGYSLVLVH